MLALLARLVAVLPVVMHGVFGCCWHHTHFHLEHHACTTVACGFHRAKGLNGHGQSCCHAHVMHQHGGSHRTNGGDHGHREPSRLSAVMEPILQCHGHQAHRHETSHPVPCEEERCELTHVASFAGVRSGWNSGDPWTLAIAIVEHRFVGGWGHLRAASPASHCAAGAGCIERARLQVWRI